MVTTKAKTVDGIDVVLIGLSFDNLDAFKKSPGHTFIRVSGETLGLDADILIFSGTTETDCAEMMLAPKPPPKPQQAAPQTTTPPTEQMRARPRRRTVH